MESDDESEDVLDESKDVLDESDELPLELLVESLDNESLLNGSLLDGSLLGGSLLGGSLDDGALEDGPLLPLEESQQIGMVHGEPASTLWSCPQMNVHRWVGKVTESPLRTGQGINTSSTVVRPLPGGHGPLLDGSLLDGSLLDGSLLGGSLLEGSLLEGSLDDGSLEEGSLLDEDSLELLDEELDELEDDELLDEDEDELDGSQQPSPRTSTSHLQLSAKCFARP